MSDKKNTILARLKSGDTPTEVAAALKISPRRVYQVRGEKPREPMTPAKAVAIRAALIAGRTIRDVAGEFRVSRKTVSKIRDELPPTKRAPIAPARIPASGGATPAPGDGLTVGGITRCRK